MEERGEGPRFAAIYKTRLEMQAYKEEGRDAGTQGHHGILSVPQTTVNEGLWKDDCLKPMTDFLTSTGQQTFVHTSKGFGGETLENGTFHGQIGTAPHVDGLMDV